MKVKVTESGKEFKPIKISIEIESREELEDLYCRVNAGAERIPESEVRNAKPSKSATYGLYCVLRDELDNLDKYRKR
jgi:hypothetical protein